MSGTVKIIKADITSLDTDAVVNAANEYLAEGGGVCGAIFDAAGSRELSKGCVHSILRHPEWNPHL